VPTSCCVRFKKLSSLKRARMTLLTVHDNACGKPAQKFESASACEAVSYRVCGEVSSRAIFFTVTGLILRKFAASSGVTNGSLSSATFTVLLHFNSFSHSERLTLKMALRMCRACMVLAGVDGRAV